MQEWALKTHSWKEVAKRFDSIWSFRPEKARPIHHRQKKDSK